MRIVFIMLEIELGVGAHVAGTCSGTFSVQVGVGRDVAGTASGTFSVLIGVGGHVAGTSSGTFCESSSIGSRSCLRLSRSASSVAASFAIAACALFAASFALFACHELHDCISGLHKRKPGKS